MNPQVSVILPVYNAAEYVSGAIKSVLDQSFTDFELIIVNDGSTDNGLDVIKGFSDERIKIINNEVNLGLQKTLNRGLREINPSSEFIARIDADDEWINNEKLQQQISFLQVNKRCVLIGTNASVVNESGLEIFKSSSLISDKDIRAKILKSNKFFHSSVVIRRSALEKTGFYSEDMSARHVEDYDLWLRLGLVGNFHNLSMVGLRYRQVSSSISSQNNILQLKRGIGLIKKYHRYYQGYFLALSYNYLKLLVYSHTKLLWLKKIFYRLKSFSFSKNHL